MSEDTDDMVTRRSLLKTGGVAAGVALSGGLATATHSQDIRDHQPDHVSIYYDSRKADIERYQPYLRTAHLSVKPEACFAAYYESSEWETDAIVYVHRYPTQQGVSSLDSHYGDREIVVLYRNPDGSIESACWSAWHYLIYRTPSPPTHDSTHPHLTVAKPHHHHYIEPQGGDTGSYPPLANFNAALDDWFANGWTASPSILLHPWEAKYKESFWAEGEFGINVTESRAELALAIARLNPFKSVQTDL